VAITQSCGGFSRVLYPGCDTLNCFVCETRVGNLSLQIEQHDTSIETRTKDNVFVTIKLAMRVKVAQSESEFPLPRAVKKIKGDKKALIDEESEGKEKKKKLKDTISSQELLYRAYYKLQDPNAQITAYIDNYFRFHAMLYTLDDMYAAKDGMTNELLNELNAKMNPYGFIIYDVLVKDIIPNLKVRDAMNDVVASEKEMMAIVNRAHAEKSAKILSSEAEARTRELEGEGIAAARRAIVEGLRQSVDDFQEAIPATDARELLTVVLMTQYMDTVKEAATKSRNTFILPSSPAQVAAIEQQMRASLIGQSANTGKKLSVSRKKKDKENVPLVPAKTSTAKNLDGGDDEDEDESEDV